MWLFNNKYQRFIWTGISIIETENLFYICFETHPLEGNTSDFFQKVLPCDCNTFFSDFLSCLHFENIHTTSLPSFSVTLLSLTYFLPHQYLFFPPLPSLYIFLIFPGFCFVFGVVLIGTGPSDSFSIASTHSSTTCTFLLLLLKMISSGLLSFPFTYGASPLSPLQKTSKTPWNSFSHFSFCIHFPAARVSQSKKKTPQADFLSYFKFFFFSIFPLHLSYGISFSIYF